MELIDQVCLPNQAKKLRELGITQDSLFYHFPDQNTDEVKKARNLPDYNMVYGGEYIAGDYLNLRTRVLMGDFNITYSAFTVAELNLMLGYHNAALRLPGDGKNEWLAMTMDNYETGIPETISCWPHASRYGHTQAEALADLLISEMEKGCIYFKDANKRLTERIEQQLA